MSKAIVDPEELRRFAMDLKRVTNELQKSMTMMHGRLMHLGQTWRDQEHTRFANELEQTVKVLQRFVEQSNDHIPFLLRKADRVEEYLQQR